MITTILLIGALLMPFPNIVPADNLLGEFVSRGESGGNYNAYNRGVAGDADTPINLTRMTIRDIQKLQNSKGADHLNAVGKYQIIRTTLEEALGKTDVTKDDVFTPEVQDKLFNYLVFQKRPKVGNYISGKSDDEFEALMELSKEFASLPRPDTGESYYDKDSAGNKSFGGLLKVEVLRGVLNEMRRTHDK